MTPVVLTPDLYALRAVHPDWSWERVSALDEYSGHRDGETVYVEQQDGVWAAIDDQNNVSNFAAWSADHPKEDPMRDSKPIPYWPVDRDNPFPWSALRAVATVKYDADLCGYVARRIGGGLCVGPAKTAKEAFEAYDRAVEARRSDAAK